SGFARRSHQPVDCRRARICGRLDSVNIVFVEPHFPRNQREFVRALAQTGATVLGVGETPADYLDDELKSWMGHYEQVRSVTDVEALTDTVRRLQGMVW